MEDLGGVEPLARGLKARCPTVSGLNAPGPLATHGASRCGLLIVARVSFVFDGFSGTVSNRGPPVIVRVL